MITLYPIVCKNRDVLVGVRRACQLGYNVSPFPGETILTDADPGGTQIADGLRQSTLNVLTSTPLVNGGENHMFVEADAYPLISCSELEKVIHDAPPDWEILQLFKRNTICDKEPQATPFVYDPTKGVAWKRISLKFAEFAGTHAMLFRDGNVVKKFKEAIKNKQEPIDRLLAVLNSNGRIRVYRPVEYNFFLPWNPETQGLRDRRFLVGLMSYRRLKDACRQIYTFMDQSYTNFVLHVMLKGVDEYDWRRRLLPNFQHFIDEGRLVVDCIPNENQLLNILHIPKGIPEESYDLITKIDDDDWYDRDYMKRLNDVHRHLPTNVGSILSYLGGVFRTEAGFPVFSGSRIFTFAGSTMVCTKELFKGLQGYVDSGYSKEYLMKIIQREDVLELLEDNYKWREDALQDLLSRSLGVVNRTFMDPATPGLCVSHCGTSMTRDGYLNYKKNTYYIALKYDRIITLAGAGSRYRILGNSIFSLKDPESELGEILDKNDNYYVVKWKNGGNINILRHFVDGKWEVSNIGDSL